MKKILFLVISMFSSFSLFSQVHTEQNGIKTSVIINLSANATLPRRYEIATIGFNSYHWQFGGIVMIEIFANSYDTGYKKYFVEVGYGQGANWGDPVVKLAESYGINKSARITLGTPYDLSTTYSGFVNKALPVYLDVKDYRTFIAKITYLQPSVISPKNSYENKCSSFINLG